MTSVKSKKKKKKKNTYTTEERRKRQEKFTYALAKSICDLIRMGSFPEVAALSNGITKMTLCNWMKWGNEYLRAEEDGTLTQKGIHRYAKYATFVDDMHRAHAEAEELDLEKLNKLGNRFPQALIYKMSIRYRDRWAEKKRLEVTGKDGQPIQSEVVTGHVHTITNLADLPLSVETMRELLAAIRAEKAKREQQTIVTPAIQNKQPEDAS